MSDFSWWMIFTGGVLVGLIVGGPSGYAVARIQVFTRRVARDWRGVKGLVKAGAFTVAGLVVVVLIGARSAGVFG